MVVTPRKHKGFTLIELLTVLSIVAILAALAAPSYREMIAKQRERSTASELLSGLMQARSEAVKRNVPVTLKPVDAAAWQKGWSIPDPANAGKNIDVRGAISGATITGPASVIFMSNGRVSGAAAPKFSITADGTTEAKCVVTDLSGRPYKLKTACLP